MNLIFTAVALSAAITFFLPAEPAPEAAYYLVAREGYVAVLDTRSGTVSRTETELSMLPPADAARLEAGIACPDEAALTRAIENFCS